MIIGRTDYTAASLRMYNKLTLLCISAYFYLIASLIYRYVCMGLAGLGLMCSEVLERASKLI